MEDDDESDYWTELSKHVVHELDLGVVNGAMRATDGTFAQLPSRVFHADGRQEMPPDEHLEQELVAYARSSRWSWKDVGEALGVSRSAAHERFAQVEVPSRRRS